jgi:outer membrane lipoprotein-sorting protein
MKIKTFNKAIALLAIVVLLFISGCAANRCNGMQHHQRDVKMGLAH